MLDKTIAQNLAKELKIDLFTAVEAGKEVIEVPAKNTSQLCSKCGQIVEKDLSVRIHKCSCGLEIDRDWNAALNTLRLGQSLRAIPRISRL